MLTDESYALSSRLQEPWEPLAPMHHAQHCLGKRREECHPSRMFSPSTHRRHPPGPCHSQLTYCDEAKDSEILHQSVVTAPPIFVMPSPLFREEGCKVPTTKVCSSKSPPKSEPRSARPPVNVEFALNDREFVSVREKSVRANDPIFLEGPFAWYRATY